jgi:hypothetical protein
MDKKMKDAAEIKPSESITIIELDDSALESVVGGLSKRGGADDNGNCTCNCRLN